MCSLFSENEIASAWKRTTGYIKMIGFEFYKRELESQRSANPEHVWIKA